MAEPTQSRVALRRPHFRAWSVSEWSNVGLLVVAVLLAYQSWQIDQRTTLLRRDDQASSRLASAVLLEFESITVVAGEAGDELLWTIRNPSDRPVLMAEMHIFPDGGSANADDAMQFPISIGNLHPQGSRTRRTPLSELGIQRGDQLRGFVAIRIAYRGIEGQSVAETWWWSPGDPEQELYLYGIVIDPNVDGVAPVEVEKDPWWY